MQHSSHTLHKGIVHDVPVNIPYQRVNDMAKKELREDTSILANMVLMKTITEAEARTYARLPLLSISLPYLNDAVEYSPTSWTAYYKRVMEDDAFAADDKLHLTQGMCLFDEFVALLYLNDDAANPIYLRMEIVNGLAVSIIYHQPDAPTHLWRLKLLGESQTNLRYGILGLSQQSKLIKERTQLDLVMNTAVGAMAWVMHFMRFNYGLERISSVKKVEGKKRVAVGLKQRIYHNSGPRIIYLDAPPKPVYEKAVERDPDYKPEPTGITQSPHERRGHFKTLRHPRFKNHPMYMVPNGMEIGAYKVGDTAAIDKGNVYTLLETKAKEK